MTSKVNPIFITLHALATLAVIIVCLPLALGVFAEQAMGVGMFDPTLGGDPALAAWTATPWGRAALLISFVSGIVHLVWLARDPKSKRLHIYHAAIAVALCLCAYILQQRPQLAAALPTALLALLYIGFWSRRLMDPGSR
ncbi:MAG: hypothetical protein H6718_26450 [Polyangiaceae bacterium]|nr:hypothetical protein [Myxococcales bacterium]MCB9588981.1 hypothetical protein [Polyangiaceae bacterium]